MSELMTDIYIFCPAVALTGKGPQRVIVANPKQYRMWETGDHLTFRWSGIDQKAEKLTPQLKDLITKGIAPGRLGDFFWADDVKLAEECIERLRSIGVKNLRNQADRLDNSVVNHCNAEDR